MVIDDITSNMFPNFKINERRIRLTLIDLLHRFGAVTFFLSGFFMNAVQLFVYLTVKPFSKDLFRRINKYFSASMYEQILFIPEWLSNLEVHIYMDRHDFEQYLGKEHSFCIINHTYEVDWLINWILCDKIQCLGNFKACSKKEAMWLPTLGWNWIFADFLFLDRSFEKDKTIIMEKIPELVSHPEPIWLTFYPEGTRLTSEKHKVSMKYASMKNLPTFKHHLLPRTKGYLACLPLMKEKVTGLYDIVLSFKGGKDFRPTYQDIIYGEKISAHIYIKRIPFDEVPQDSEKAKTYLYEMFETKDKIQDSFFKTEDFFSESGVERLPPMKLKRGYASLLNFIFWNVFLTIPLLVYWISLYYSQNYIFFIMILSFIVLANIFMTWTMDYTSIKTASSYGMEIKTTS